MRVFAWRLLKVTFATVYTIVAAEIFLRVLNPVAIVPRYVTATPYGVRGNEPNRVYRQVSSEYDIEIRTNSRGIRANEEIPYEKPAGTKRIVILGDSFAMGYESDLPNTFLARMQQELAAAGQPVQLVNLAVSGHGNAEELITLQEEGLKYSPDLVLLCWHASDYSDNIRSGLYALKNGQLVRRNATYLPGVRAQQVLYSLRPFEWFATHSQAYSFVREFAAMRIAKPALLIVRKALSPSTARGEAEDETGTKVAPYHRELTVALVKRIEQLSREHGARFLILDIPARRSRTEFASVFPQDEKSGRYDLPVISPISIFTANAGPKIYWEKSQGHFTPLGNQLVGHVLAQAIIKDNLLGQGAGRAQRDLPGEARR